MPRFSTRDLPFQRQSLAIATGCLLAGLPLHTFAEEVQDLDDVIVTASRSAQTVDETLAPVTVITRKEIERSQATSVTELLNKTPGLQITSSGGPGSASGIYLRGTKSAQTLVLVDGMKINAADSGSASLEFLDPSQIERIEIVRGPRSTLYGPDAIGGVINIFTKQGKGKPSLTVKASAGSRTTGSHSVNYGGKIGDTRFNLQAGLFETKGYDRTTNTLSYDGDDDAYRNKNFSGSLSHNINPQLKVGTAFTYNEGKTEYDSSYITTGYPITYFNNATISSFASLNISDAWLTKVDVGFSDYTRENTIDDAPNGKTNNKRYSANWLNDIAWANNQQLVTGIDYSNEYIDSSTSNYTVDSRYNVGVYAQNTTTLNNSELQLGLRQDHNEAYGDNTTGNISWGFNLPYDMRLITSYGTAFRAPTFMDLYYPGSENPDLKAETSQNYEIGLQGKITSTTNWSVNAYQNDMKDMLEYQYNEDTGQGKVINISKARIRGLEFNVTTQLAAWHFNTNLTFLDPENRSGTNAGKTLYRRAEQLLNINIDRELGRWTVGGTIRAQGPSWNDPENTEEVPGFATADLRASVQVIPTLKAQFKVVNVLDKEYSTTQGYRDEPRGGFVTLIWTPEL